MVQVCESPSSFGTVPDMFLPTGEELYTQYSSQIYTYLYRFTKSREEAEDLMQETFLRACKALPRIREPLKVSSWLYKIATNVAYDALRRRHLVTWLSLDVWKEEREAEYPSGMADDPAEQVSEAECVHMAFAQLPAGYRQALLCYGAEGYSYAEVAQVVGIAQSGVKMYISRARKRLRQYYQQLDER
jgi:RNA polymerase sigma-70 factor (ECF subfamily)